MDTVMQARGALGGRPRRLSYFQLQANIEVNKSPAAVKNKEIKIKRRT
jgi:hypothetical protein